MVRVFASGEPGEARRRLAFLGAYGEALDAFLRDLRAMIVAVPASRISGGAEQARRVVSLLDADRIPYVVTSSHLVLSFSSIEQVATTIAGFPTLSESIAAAFSRYLKNKFHVPVSQGVMDLSGPPLLMGVLNVTPDSFSDGGSYPTAEAAIRRGLEMEAEGAAIIDVGGESTRPGSLPVGVEEEIRRVIPVIRGLAAKTKAILSVDTTKSTVARAATEAGARIVNDTSALADDPGMPEAVRGAGCAVVLMHRRGMPQTMQRAPRYDFLFDELVGELAGRVDAAIAAGIDRERILVDPGIGFGKRLTDNLALHRHLGELRVLGRPIVFGPSRKAFVGTLTGAPAARRQFGTAAAVTAAVMAGAHVLRVHDVREMREVVRVAAAIREAGEC